MVCSGLGLECRDDIGLLDVLLVHAVEREVDWLLSLLVRHIRISALLHDAKEIEAIRQKKVWPGGNKF